MKIPMYKRYESEKPVGAIALCNTFGISIFNPDEYDKTAIDYALEAGNYPFLKYLTEKG